MMELYRNARLRVSDNFHTLSLQTRGRSVPFGLIDPSTDSNHSAVKSQTTRELTEIPLYLSVSGITR